MLVLIESDLFEPQISADALYMKKRPVWASSYPQVIVLP